MFHGKVAKFAETYVHELVEGRCCHSHFLHQLRLGERVGINVALKLATNLIRTRLATGFVSGDPVIIVPRHAIITIILGGRGNRRQSGGGICRRIGTIERVVIPRHDETIVLL